MRSCDRAGETCATASNYCLEVVPPEELLDHAMEHATAVGDNGIPSDPADDSLSEFVTPSAPIITRGGDLKSKAR